MKFEIIKHLPLLIFGRKQGGKGDESLSFMASNGAEELRDAQKISSVYVSTPSPFPFSLSPSHAILRTEEEDVQY